MSARRALAFSVDIRPGEWHIALLAFGALALILAGHTVLETARDALLLTKVPARGIGIVYVALAACTLPAAAAAARSSERFGPHPTLVGTMVAASAMALALFAIPTTSASVMTLYIASGLIGSIAVTQFWSVLGTLLTVTQGRRLIGPIASAGVIGGVVGSGTAALALPAIPVKALLPFAAAIFLAAAGLLLFVPASGRPSDAPRAPAKPLGVLREEPFLIRVALVVALSTATLLAIDYFFKWSVLRTVPREHVGVFVARYYAFLNGVSLVVQLVFASAVVRRLGVATSISVTPLLLLACGASTVVLGGTIPMVLLLKGGDDSLRNSVHRTTIELLYLPVRSDIRQRAKLLIDGALGRLSQAIAAAALLGLTGAKVLSPRGFAAIVVGLAAAWFASTAWARSSYLGLLRRAIGSPHVTDGPDPFDLAGAEVLVEHLASDEPMQVIAAMAALERRGRQRLIPALVLHHRDERVLEWALERFGASSRRDWISLGRRLLEDRREKVRLAAVRALATAESAPLDLDRLSGDAGPTVNGYSTLLRVLAEPGKGDALGDPRIMALLADNAPDGEATRLGIVAAIADSPPDARLSNLLVALPTKDAAPESRDWVQLLARAASRQREPRMIPWLVARLATRDRREAVQAALVDLGDAALEGISAALSDRTRDRRLRVHLPATLARFGTQRAADFLLEDIETEADGLVRYKSIRALGRLVAEGRVRVDRARVERLSQSHMLEHFRIRALRLHLGAAPFDKPTDGVREVAGRLLADLLDDKLRQSLERAFRLLKMAYPAEDIHAVHLASLSPDARARANAGEFLEALINGHDQATLRELFRLVTDDLPPAARVARAATFLTRPAPNDREEAVAALIDDLDLVVSALAAFYAATLGSVALTRAAERARRLRPEMDRAGARLFDSNVPFASGVT